MPSAEGSAEKTPGSGGTPGHEGEPGLPTVSCPCHRHPKPQGVGGQRGSCGGLSVASAMGCFWDPGEDAPLVGIFWLKGVMVGRLEDQPCWR